MGQPEPPIDFATVLVCVAQLHDIHVERGRVGQLLAESRHAWPGDPTTLWWKWLAESGKSLGLRVQFAQVQAAEACDLVKHGFVVVCHLRSAGRVAILRRFDGRRVEMATDIGNGTIKVTLRELADQTRVDNETEDGPTTGQFDCLIFEDPAASHEQAQRLRERPVARLLALLRPERSDIWVVAVFAFFAGLLSLATPIAVESLVNIVAFGRLLQPLVVLSIMLFGFLGFASTMRALQTFVVEIIQRRLFARVAGDLAYRFPRVRHDAFGGHYGPELANRFFDVVTLQKVVAQLLLDGIAIVLATVIGMIVLAFYHPWLLGFDLLLLVSVVAGVLLLGHGAVASGIDESKQKYRLAAWLEDVLRCPIGFRAAGAADFAFDRANGMTTSYLTSRQRHFRVLFKQLIFILGLQAVAGTLLLGCGGWLVIRNQLTLGQLVAAELIVAMILASLAKLGKYIEGFYDLVAAVDKLGHLFDLEMETQEGLLTLDPGDGVRLRITDVELPSAVTPAARGFSIDVVAGERLALLGHGRAGSTALFDMLYGLRSPDTGHIEIEQTDPRDLRPDVLRRVVALVRGVEIFAGTIAENVQLGRPGVSITDVRTALAAVGLLDTVLRLPEGLDTTINAAGRPLLATQQQLLMIARGLAGRPRLLLIDGVLDSLGDTQLRRVGAALLDLSRNCTLLVATNRSDVAAHFERVVDPDTNALPRALLPQPTS